MQKRGVFKLPLLIEELSASSSCLTHTQICKVYQLMHWHDPYACTEGYVLYVHARKRQFVHDHGPCACTEDCLMYGHSRKHHFVHDKTTHDLQEKHWTRTTECKTPTKGWVYSLQVLHYCIYLWKCFPQKSMLLFHWPIITGNRVVPTSEMWSQEQLYRAIYFSNPHIMWHSRKCRPLCCERRCRWVQWSVIKSVTHC